ncbi:MAG: hypothetical protein AAGD34_01630 [Pseudomonadota bacterium]
MTDTPERADLHAAYREMMATFRFYIALTVFANLLYALVFGGFLVAFLMVTDPLTFMLPVVLGMVSTGFAVLSVMGIPEAKSLARAITATGARLGLPHVTRAHMLPAQTALTFIFHALLALVLFAYVFFAGVLTGFA